VVVFLAPIVILENAIECVRMCHSIRIGSESGLLEEEEDGAGLAEDAGIDEVVSAKGFSHVADAGEVGDNSVLVGIQYLS